MSEIFIWPSDCGRYIRMRYTHSRARVLPRRRVCVSREGAEKRMYLHYHSRVLLLAGRPQANGRYISGLAFMWRPTVELIFTRFELDPLLPSSSSSTVLNPRSEHASTMSRNSRFQPLSLPSLTLKAGYLVTTPLRIYSHAKFNMLC